jgi:hypothetical protein
VKSLSVRRVERDRSSNSFVVSLREDDHPRRQFDIYIGLSEGIAIRMMLDGEVAPRPLTHDLFVLALERVGVTLKHVVITHVSNGTYFAEIVLSPEAGEGTVVSCRPSDALALALRSNSPIYAQESLLDEVARVPDESEDSSAEILDEFKEFIENINPDDFDI